MERKMERGIYFDGWYRNNHCYHPSLPVRSMQMIEDIEEYRGTVLVWSALGGGSISLPYLEHEAFGRVDPRLRFYGFMNDSEFIAECNKRDIKVFGIVFEVQGWEFPAVFSEDGGEFKELNVLRSDGPHDWYGLREFTSGRHSEVFGKKLTDYFPNGLYNSDGEAVEDLLEECCARDYNGVPCHSEWVEVKNHKQIAYQMCRNNPVWREYLKAVIRIQIDAGVAGVQLDECELPMTSIRYGGCFCKDCMKQFNEYLKELKSENGLPDELKGVDLDAFHYGEYLKERDIPYPGDVKNVPLYKHYWEFQLRAIKKHFKELTDYVKEYGRSKGREVLVSGNFFNIMPSYYPLETEVDVIITEMRQTLFKQPYWYRYVAGFAGEKPVIVAENPYGGVIPELLKMLNGGKAYDLYRLLLLEASAYGCNMSVPYGGWMGNTIKDAFYPPKDVTAQVQDFLVSHEGLFGKKSGANVLVLYSFPSYYWREAISGYSDSMLDGQEGILSYSVADMDDPNSVRLPFWEVIKDLSDRQVVYDVKFTADGELREDRFGAEDLSGYEVVIIPDCMTLTANQTGVLREYAQKGGKLIIFGEAGTNVKGWLEGIRDGGNVIFASNDAFKPKAIKNFEAAFDKAYGGIWQVRADNPHVGLQTHKTENGTAIHIINYGYNREADEIQPIKEINLSIRGNFTNPVIRIHTLNDKKVEYTSKAENDTLNIKLFNVPIYTIVELKD